MTAAPRAADEPRRLAALRAYRVLDTSPERAFDDITMLAAHICGTPIALTSLVDEKAATIVDQVRGALADDDHTFSLGARTRPPQRQEFEISLSSVHAPDGEYRGRLVVLRDVTNEREVDRMKTEFVSLVSQELRTPLTSVRGYVDLILEGDAGPVTDEQRDYLTVVKQNANRLVALVNDLLDISRMKAGRVQLDRARSMSPVIEDVAATVAPEIQAKRQELRVAVTPDLRPVLGDRNRIVQVVTNLVTNAHKYTPVGGRIEVRALVVPPAVATSGRDRSRTQRECQRSRRAVRRATRVASRRGSADRMAGR